MPSRRSHIAVLLSLLLLATLLARAGLPQERPTLATQRADFLAAEQALRKADFKRYNRLIAKLQDYPLLPYLEYQRLRQNIRHRKDEEIESFLTRYAATPLAGLLRSAWLKELARRGQWSSYQAFYKPTNSITQRCNYIHALFKTEQQNEAMPMVREIWLSGRSQPKACDPVFKIWGDLGGRTDNLVWQRIDLAFQRNNSRLAGYLGRFLSAAQRPVLEQWLDIHRHPKRLPSYIKKGRPHPQKSQIIVHGFKRLGAKNIDLALKTWNGIKPEKYLSAEQIYKVKRALALRLAWNKHDRAIAWLDQIEPLDSDQRLHETRIRTALALQDWQHAEQWISKLPDKLRHTERWRYWRARAYEHLGNHTAAKALLTSLAKERSYHGFLAADRLGSAYKLSHTPLKLPAALIDEIRRRPGLLRTHELLHHGRRLEARREWRFSTRHMNRQQLQAAAKIAQSWEWHDRAIFTLAKTEQWDDLELRFPLAHKKQIDTEARKQHLDRSWIYAVVRQESAFAPDAVSPTGALGLMQLMPRTAKLAAKKLRVRRFRKSDLFDPATNIMLGAKYLRLIWDQLGGHQVLATAAYNAGPRRVRSWLPEKTTDSALWIETLPFQETRTYTQRVLTYSVIYDSRRGKKPRRISRRMRPIPSSISRQVAAIAADKKKKT